MKTHEIEETKKVLDSERNSDRTKPKEQFPTKAGLVLYFLKGSKKWFVLCVLFSMAVSFLDMVNPKLISYTVDSVIGGGTPELPGFLIWLLENTIGGADYIREHLILIALTVGLFALLAGICRYFSRLLNVVGSEKMMKRMRDSLFRHILKLPFTWHNENHTGDIIQRCTSDVETIRNFVSEQLTSLLRVVILIVMALSFMAGINGMMTIVAAAFIPVIVGYSLLFHSRIGSTFEQVDIEEGKLSSIAQENLTGVRVVRAFGREIHERKRFEKQNVAYTNMWVRLMQLLSIFWGLGDFFSGTQILLVTVLGAMFCVRGSLTAGEYIAFVTYNAMLTWPVRSLGRVISEMARAGISVERIRYIMNSVVERDKEGAERAAGDVTSMDISFNHVTFSYGDGPEVLRDVSFDIEEGTTVGILGGTGSGKSTVMDLLDRLYELPRQNGTITIGGVNISNLPAEWVRTHVGLVLQEPFLFSRTLYENIKIAKEDASEEEVRAAARAACLDETIGHFKQGYETFVGERGVTLSGGQKQRTAIAQMLIRKPPVMVFDDSLSAVDAETDMKIRRGLKDYTGGSTVILISHRITTLMQADKIVVLDKGRVAEQGTHESLIEAGGIYSRIYELQVRQSEEADVEYPDAEYPEESLKRKEAGDE